MYSTQNKRKSVGAERFFGNLKEQNLQIHGFSFQKCLY